MQVYPKYWFKELSKKFSDPNIEADSTNLRYGIYILSHLSRRTAERSADTGVHWRTALLRYSPQFVQMFVEKLMTYAVGRGMEYTDMPTIRAIARPASTSSVGITQCASR